jgi:hypothetical protein
MAGVGFQREAVWLTSLTRPRPFPPETASKRAGASEHDLGPPMPKQPNGTPGKKPPAPSVKVRLGRKNMAYLPP